MNQDKPKPIIPTYDRLMSPTLRALIELGGSASNQEIEQKVAELFGFTEEQLAILHGRGRQSEIAYREAWARTYLRADGAIDQSGRGIWVITDRGRNLSADEIDSLPKRVKATYRTRGRNEEGAEESAGDDESPTTLLDSALKDWREALLDLLRSLPPDAFERLSQRVLRESGFTSVEVTGKSGDGGIDGIGVLSISLLSFQVLFQCKRYTGPVGPKEIRDFRGAMVGRTDKGLFSQLAYSRRRPSERPPGMARQYSTLSMGKDFVTC